ncbi:MAG TPA: UDP-N-acetylmuramoyl-L-alanyl-D-glutamate--2,6-diaminopimelate ligase [Bryobacteraceae bacterium]|nr:UDP-N-acetylmuramoyl-L-alanyl-D-glutamate--2,6-diaminopimelate ligase [Bryobacteraceae bacterium]
MTQPPTLAAILEGVAIESAGLPADLQRQPITGLTYDSRAVEPGYVFFAFEGAKVDGRRYATDAIAKGAAVIVSESPGPDDCPGNWIQVKHGRRALALAASNFYGHPDRRLHLTGITGTNGKTTTSYLLDSIWRQAGKTTALIGTIEYRLAGRLMPSVNTTPESLDLLRTFVELENAGGTHVTMETSSHALALGRVHGIRFETAVFTNLTRDHLDFHRSMEEYFDAKRKLFTPEGAEPPRYAVVNYDDPYGRALKTKPETEVFWYGLEDGAGARALRIHSGFEGLRFEVQFRGEVFPIQSPMVGQINVYNILAAWCAAYANGVDPEVIQAGIAACSAVPGRFERVTEGQPFLVVVDYAHTDDALRNTIAAARNLTAKRVITLFGCGGDRDRNKRPLMGSAAAQGSDLVVLTSDNPRSEDPLAIMTDALVGIRRHDTPYIAEVDRVQAIQRALDEARAGDVVVIAGKGHETYQVLKDRTIAFDDRDVARTALRRLGYGLTAQAK